MFSNFIVSTLIELIVINLLNYLVALNVNQLANGCYSYIFALYINYCKDIPKEKFDFFGLSFSEKLLVYFFGIQMMFTSYSVLIACVCGILSGLICRSNAFNSTSIQMPKRFLKLMIKLLNAILLSNNVPKESALNGATHQERSRQYIELYEENLLNNQFNFLNRTDQLPSASFASSTQAAATINEAELESNINQLKEMGFELQSIKRTLKNTNNDLSRATHLLLEDAS